MGGCIDSVHRSFLHRGDLKSDPLHAGSKGSKFAANTDGMFEVVETAGGMIIGFAEIYAGQYLSGYTYILGAGYQQIVPYIVMLAVLLVRPYGLFWTEEIRRV